MALLPGSPEAVRADSLIDQLAEYGITYITGGQGAGNQLDTNSRPHANNPAAVRLFAELSDAPAVRVADLCRMLDLPNAEQDHGEALLAAVSRWLDPTETTDWAGGWENAAAQLLSDLRFEPAHAG
jgi:hypothetical protein